MSPRVLFLFVTILVLCACSSSGDDTQAPVTPPDGTPACTDGAPGCIGWKTCPPEMTSDPTGCREILPAAECGPGTMAVLGESTCAPVGPTSCPDGFAKAASGWGCEAVLPPQTCTGATRDALGSTTCAAVGDCNAAFPPADATLFVNASYADADLGPTKFRTITDATAAAGKGAVIAVFDGTYLEGIKPRTGMTIVGRCAEKVKLDGTALSVWGVLANNVKDVVVRGVTLQGHYEGARAQGGGTLTITDSVIEAPRFTGLIAYQPNSLIHAERVVVRNVQPVSGQSVAVTSVNADVGGAVELESSELAGNYEAGMTATNVGDVSRVRSTLKMNHSVIRDTNLVEHSPAGAGVVASGYSTATVTESAILNTRRLATAAFDPTAVLDVQRSVLEGSLEDSSGELAGAAFITDGAAASYTDVSMRGFVQSGIVGQSKGAITAKNVVIEGTVAGKDGDFGVGGFLQTGALLTMDSSAIVGNAYYGLAVLDAGSTATLVRVLVADTNRTSEDVLGRGINVEDGGTLNFDRLTLLRNGDEQLFIRGETKAGARANGTGTRLYVADGKTRKDNSTGSSINIEMGAFFSLDTAAVLRSHRAGIIVNESLGDAGSSSEATITHAIVRDTLAAGDGLGQTTGIAIEGVGVGCGGKLTLHSSSIVNSVEFGLAISGPHAVGDIASCYVAGTAPQADGFYGHGILTSGGASAVIASSEVSANRIGLAFAASTAVVSSCLVDNNDVGIHVQAGSTLATAPNAPDAPTESVILVTDDSQFVDNVTRVGSGEVPLPTNPFGE